MRLHHPRILKTIALAIIATGACALAYSYSNIGDYPHKLWLHRCNSPQKWEEKKHLYDNFELDIVYRDNGTFDVTHDIDITHHQPLDTFLAIADDEDCSIWLDMKNITPRNDLRALHRLNYLTERHNLDTSQIIIESNSLDALETFDSAGYYTAYYVTNLHPDRLSDSDEQQILRQTRDAITSGSADALSIPGWWYQSIKQLTDTMTAPIDLLVWQHRTTQLEFFLTPSCHQMLHDPQVKVILVKDKGSFHR